MPRRKSDGGAFKLFGKTYFRPKSPAQLVGKEKAFVDYVNRRVTQNGQRDSVYEFVNVYRYDSS